METPVIETPRFILRQIRPDDVAAFWPAFSDPSNMRWWSRSAFSSQQELADWLLDPDWTGRSWIAHEISTGAAVCRVVATVHSEGVAEIGYATVLDRQAQGIARECVSSLITHLFRTESMRRIWADVDPDNIASNALLKTLGFTCEGRLRAAWKTHIGIRDSLIWGILSKEWPDKAA